MKTNIHILPIALLCAATLLVQPTLQAQTVALTPDEKMICDNLAESKKTFQYVCNNSKATSARCNEIGSALEKCPATPQPAALTPAEKMICDNLADSKKTFQNVCKSSKATSSRCNEIGSALEKCPATPQPAALTPAEKMICDNLADSKKTFQGACNNNKAKSPRCNEIGSALAKCPPPATPQPTGLTPAEKMICDNLADSKKTFQGACNNNKAKSPRCNEIGSALAKCPAK